MITLNQNTNSQIPQTSFVVDRPLISIDLNPTHHNFYFQMKITDKALPFIIGDCP